MRESDLPTPGIGARGFHLRRLVAASVSQLDVNKAAYGGRHPNSVPLTAMFQAAIDALEDMLPIASNVTFTPTAKSFSLAAGASQAGPAVNSGGHTGVPTYSSATPAKATVDPVTGAITPVATGTSVITISYPANGGWLATTKTYVATVTA